MADNNPKKSNRYFTKGGYYKIKRLLEERTERAEEWLKGYKKPLLAIGATALTFAGLTLVHKEQLGVTEAKEFSENQQYHMEIEREGNYVVTYINTNAYSEVPDYNKIERLVPGDIIEYAPAYVGRYVESDEMAGYWELDSENKNSQATKWDFCINRGTGNSGYVPDQYVTKFLPFQLSDGEQSVKYKSSPDLQYDGEIESDQYVYVNLEEMYEDSEGNQIFQIITRKTYDVLEDDTGKTQTKYEYTTGFMGIDGLKSVKNMDAIGVINNATFLREYPVVTELQNDIVIDLFQNGQRLSVTEAIEEGPETWYKCTIPGSSKVFYVASYAVKNVHEYDMQIEYSGDEAGEIVKAGNDENKYILQGDKVYIDTTTRSGDLVEVMVNGCTGYIDVKKLGLYYLSEEDISENPQNENGTNQTKKDSVSQNPVTQNDSVNNVQYIIDLSDFSHFEDYLKKVSELKSEGKLGGVIFEIGGTKLNENFTKKIIADRESDTQEYINNTNTNNVSLQKYYDDINSHFVANQRVTDTVMGNWEDFIKHVKTAVDSDIPVGFYYYSCAVNANEASAEAAYINAIYQKVYNEIPEFKDAKQFPITIDIEDAGKYRNELKTERTAAVAEIVKILGNGTSNQFCWQTGKNDASEGYGIIDNQYILYAGATATVDKTEKSNLGLYITSLESIQNMTNDYDMIKFYACALCVDIDYDSEIVKKNLIGQNLVDAMKENKYYTGDTSFSKSNIKAADLVQCMLNIDYDKWKNGNSTTLPIDITATDKETIADIVNGTYTHRKDFIDKLDEAVQEQYKFNSSEYTISDYQTDISGDGYQSYDMEIE